MGDTGTSGGFGQLRAARELVSRSIEDQREDTRNTAMLLAGECAANAVRHGGGAFEMRVERRGDRLRVEVADRSPELPRPTRVPPECERGRGLALVDGLATRWGTEPVEHDGKIVWFELSLD